MRLSVRRKVRCTSTYILYDLISSCNLKTKIISFSVEKGDIFTSFDQNGALINVNLHKKYITNNQRKAVIQLEFSTYAVPHFVGYANLIGKLLFLCVHHILFYPQLWFLSLRLCNPFSHLLCRGGIPFQDICFSL